MSKPHELSDEEPVAGSIDDEWTVTPDVATTRLPLIARIGAGAAGFAVLALVGTVILPLLAPASLTAGLTERLLSSFFGTGVAIKGPHAISLFPSIHIEAEDVSVHTFSGQKTGLDVEKIELEVSTFGAIAGSFDIDTLVLLSPVYSYHVTSTTDRDEGLDSAWGWWRNMSVENIRIEGGMLRMHGRHGSLTDVVTGLNLETVLENTITEEGKLLLRGDMVVMGEPFDLQASTADPSLLVSGNRWPFMLQFQSRLLNGAYDGSLAMRERLLGEGVLTGRGEDLQAVLAWAALTNTPEQGGSFDLRAQLKNTNLRFAVMEFNASIGGVDIDGVFDHGGDDVVIGRLAANNLDLNTIGIGLFSGLAKVLPPSEIDVTWPEGNWRGQPIGQGNITISRGSDATGLTVEIKKAEAFGGILRGEFRLNQSEGADALDVKLRLVGAAANSILGLGTGLISAPIAGSASVNANLFSVGRNTTELMQALIGTADIVVNDGVLDMPALAEVLGPADDFLTIRFETLNGRFDIAQGIAKSEDIIMQGEGISLVAQGKVDLLTGGLELDVGRLEASEDGRSLARYRLSGPAGNLRVDALN